MAGKNSKSKYCAYFTIGNDVAACNSCSYKIPFRTGSSTNTLRHHLAQHHPELSAEMKQQEERKREVMEGLTTELLSTSSSKQQPKGVPKRRTVNLLASAASTNGRKHKEEPTLDDVEMEHSNFNAANATSSFYEIRQSLTTNGGEEDDDQLGMGMSYKNNGGYLGWGDEQQNGDYGQALPETDIDSLDSRLKLAKIAYLEAQTDLAIAQTETERVRAQLLKRELKSKTNDDNHNSSS